MLNAVELLNLLDILNRRKSQLEKGQTITVTIKQPYRFLDCP